MTQARDRDQDRRAVTPGPARGRVRDQVPFPAATVLTEAAGASATGDSESLAEPGAAARSVLQLSRGLAYFLYGTFIILSLFVWNVHINK